MKGVILAAGEGVRLQPLSLTRPKVMLPVAGKPFLQCIVECFSAAGITDVCIVVGYMQDKIRSYFREGSQFGTRISYIEQSKPSGTADAIALVEDFIENGDFLLSNGDVMVRRDEYRKLLSRHTAEDSDVTIAAHPVDDPSQFGIVESTGRDQVTRIVEKPVPGQTTSNLANCGIYVFSNKIFEAIRKTQKSNRGEYEITESIQHLIDRKAGPVTAHKIGDWWTHIGKPWDLLEANEVLMKDNKSEYRVEGEVEGSVTIKPPVKLGKKSILRAGTYIEGPVIIGAECDIGPNTYIRPFTSIGNKCRVGNACEVKNSIIMDRTHVPHLSYVGDSIIGENVNFGAGTITANLRLDEKPIFVTVKGERVNSGRRKLGAVVGDNVRTGIGVTIMPGVTIGPDSAIGANIIVDVDVPRNTFVGEKRTVSSRNWPA
jgi:UDP-N-acetylglucosamine diphosphorylase/glucosamine-1-phosphate N-acetyltransferase